MRNFCVDYPFRFIPFWLCLCGSIVEKFPQTWTHKHAHIKHSEVNQIKAEKNKISNQNALIYGVTRFRNDSPSKTEMLAHWLMMVRTKCQPLEIPETFFIQISHFLFITYSNFFHYFLCFNKIMYLYVEWQNRRHTIQSGVIIDVNKHDSDFTFSFWLITDWNYYKLDY